MLFMMRSWTYIGPCVQGSPRPSTISSLLRPQPGVFSTLTNCFASYHAIVSGSSAIRKLAAPMHAMPLWSLDLPSKQMSQINGPVSTSNELQDDRFVRIECSRSSG